MSEGQSGKPAFDKGDRAAIVAGRKGVGVRGSVFWIGDNKYGPGMRYGLRGDDGETYWADETEIGSEEGAPPAPPPKEKKPSSGKTFEKGDYVTITSGPGGVGLTCQVFWTGASKYSDEMRYGVKSDDDETFWVDGNQVEAANPPSGSKSLPTSGDATSEADGSLAERPAGASEVPDSAPGPTDGDLPPEAFEDGEAPPEAYEDDIPF